jgi:hypothetical protein
LKGPRMRSLTCCKAQLSAPQAVPSREPLLQLRRSLTEIKNNDRSLFT